jgi:hypothetical protein
MPLTDDRPYLISADYEVRAGRVDMDLEYDVMPSLLYDQFLDANSV